MKDLSKSTIIESKTGKLGGKKGLGIDVGVVAWEQCKGYTEYTLRVRTKLFNYTVKKRYSEFYDLYYLLQKKYPKKFWPRLPERLIFGNSDPQKLEDRRQKLEVFLIAVVEIYLKDLQIREISRFIELQNENVRKLIDINESNLQLNDKCIRAYLSVLYNKDQLRCNLALFLALITRTVVEKQVVQTILCGEGAIHSVFSEAFIHDEGWNDPKMYLSKAEKPSFFSMTSQDAELCGEEGKIFQVTPLVAHYKCAMITSAILTLFEPVKCVNAAFFRNLLYSTRMECWLAAFQEHLQSPYSTACKMNCYQLLKLFLDLSNFCDINTVFTVETQREQFLCWMKAVSCVPTKAVVPLLSPGKPFALDAIIVNGVVYAEKLEQWLTRFHRTESRDLIMHNEELNYSRLSFVVEEQLRNDFIKTLTELSCAKKGFLVSSLRRSKKDSATSSIVDEKICFYKSLTNAKVTLVAFFAIYKVEKPDKTILIFVETEPESKDCAEQFHRSMCEAPAERLAHLHLVESNSGFFIVIEKNTENPDKFLVSLLLVYGFTGGDSPKYLETFHDMRKRIKFIKNCFED